MDGGSGATVARQRWEAAAGACAVGSERGRGFLSARLSGSGEPLAERDANRLNTGLEIIFPSASCCVPWPTGQWNSR